MIAAVDNFGLDLVLDVDVPTSSSSLDLPAPIPNLKIISPSVNSGRGLSRGLWRSGIAEGAADAADVRRDALLDGAGGVARRAAGPGIRGLQLQGRHLVKG